MGKQPDYAENLEDLKQDLSDRVRREFEEEFGRVRPSWVHFAVDYFWDESRQNFRLKDLLEGGFSGESRVLDVGAGYGQFVLRALEEGYDVYGIEPDCWKIDFFRKKVALQKLPRPWGDRVLGGVGEAIPFADNSFDYVTSYQTMEHVQNPSLVIMEMVRVTKPGGCIQVRCPDYRGTYEGHYQLPWLPLFPRPLARVYLGMLGRPRKGLDRIQYITRPRLLKWVDRVENRITCKLSVRDQFHEEFVTMVRLKRLPVVPGAYFLYRFMRGLRAVFREEENLNCLIRVMRK